LFVVVALVQLTVAANHLWRSEWTLRTGKPYKFRTRPVDPYDAFRGRYVALAFEQCELPWEGEVPRESFVDSWYAVLSEDANGFAKVLRLTPVRPEGGDFLRVKTTSMTISPDKSNFVRYSFSFDRFYMEERKAPKVERIYRDNNRWGGTNRTTYAVVRVRNGVGVIEDLFVGDKPIRELAVSARRSSP